MKFRLFNDKFNLVATFEKLSDSKQFASLVYKEYTESGGVWYLRNEDGAIRYIYNGREWKEFKSAPTKKKSCKKSDSFTIESVQLPY